MDFGWTDEQQALRLRARELARSGAERFGAIGDSWVVGFSREFSRELANAGFIGMTWPVEHGGGGRPAIERLIVAEEMISAGAPIAATWFVDRQIGPSLIAHGNDEQRREHLPRMLAGEVTWCIGMSEPDAGSDLASLRTAAHRDGDRWVIDGRKVWTSFGETADFCYLIARTSPEERGAKGISELIVPMDAPGVEVRAICDMTGGRHFCEVTFDAVEVPIGNLVGAEGKAFGQTMRQLELERGGIDRLLSNHLLYVRALARVDTSDPVVRQEVAGIETAYRIGRLLVTREVLGQAPAGFSAATKAFCTEHEWDVAQFVAATLGPEAMLWDQVTQGLSYAPGYTIMGGTSNVMRNILGERVLGLPR